MAHTQNQKRWLDDPGDVSVLRAQQAAKKGQKKATAQGSTNSTSPAPNTILPTSLTDPTPTSLSDEESMVAPKKNPPRKKKVAKGAAVTPLDVSAETPQATPANVITGVAPIEDAQALVKRKKTPSLVAQKVAVQEATENNKKATKKKKQTMKAASTAIDESPKATRLFLERAKAAATSKPDDSAASGTPGTTASITTSSRVTDHTTNQGGKAPPSKRTTLNQLVRAHQSSSTANTPSIVSTALSFSSITPSDSISQGSTAQAPVNLEAPPCSQPKKKSNIC